MQQKKVILKLLRPGAQRLRMYGSWFALSIGLLLLFASVMAWFDFREILSGKGKEDSMSSYLVVGKKVTDETMLKNPGENLFSAAEISGFGEVAGVKEVGALTANNYPVSASMGGNLGFYTEMFLGSVENQYLDMLPEDWEWQPGNPSLPIIISNDFLNLYNYGFARSQGLPQLSQQSVRSLPFEINIAGGKERYRARIVGFTDRISSVLVPQNFMDEMNRRYAAGGVNRPSRLIVKVEDPSDKQLVRFLKAKGYTTNEEQLRWNRVRTAVQAIVTSVGGVALVVVGMSVLAFLLFVEVTVQRAAAQIRLMKQLGYAPRTLRKILNRFFLPWLGSAVIVAAAATFLLHVFMTSWLRTMELQLDIADAWIIAVMVAVAFLLLSGLLRQYVGKILKSV